MKKTKAIHIGIIILGIIFISISSFHSNVWFDESYSVALCEHSFKEIWQIGGNDVHPVLYYMLLHILYLIFGSNMIVYRLFSVLGIALIGILGYTHLRKDFGEKTGIIFSYLSFFMPVMCVYATEIRMYSLAALFAILTAIYAYRILKQNSKKNWILFGVSSLALSYTHYYGLMTAGIINLALFIFSIYKRKEDKNYLKYFLIQAIAEIILYVPWLIYFITQLKHVGGGFWIKLKFPDTLIEVLSFQYRGLMDSGIHFNLETILPFAFCVIIYAYIGYLIYKQIKQKNDIKAGVLAFGVYIAVIVAALIISKFMPILYSRYIFVITSILIFALAFFMSTEKRKYITIILLALMGIISIYNEYKISKVDYAPSNMEQVKYLKDNINENDIIIYSDVITNSGASIYFKNNKQYFLNLENWGVEEAYKAFLPAMETTRNFEFLNNYKGRIWILDNNEQTLFNKLKEQGYDLTILNENKKIETKYHNYIYNIMLVEIM